MTTAMEVNKSKIGNQNPDAIMYQGADTPSEQQVTQRVKKLNPWKQECWHAEYTDSNKDKHVVYNKDKTLMNCYVKYNIAKAGSTSSLYPVIDNPQVYNVSASQLKAGYLTTDIPVIKEIEDFNPNILIRSRAREAEPSVIFASRNYPDNDYTRKLFQAIREYFKNVPLVGSVSINSLFGAANTFGAHWHMGDVQQLHGARDKWVIRIGDGTGIPNPSLIRDLGVWMIQSFANTGFDDITFTFNKEAVTVLDNTFSATKPSLWGTFNFKVTYDNVDKPYPYIVYKPGTKDIVECQGIIPVSMIKTFRASKISQEGLNNFFKNSLLRYVKDITGCFAEKLRCNHDTIPAAYNCQPYEESLDNTILLGQHPFWIDSKILYRSSEGSIYFWDPGNRASSNILANSQGGMLEAFMDSSIKYFHPVIDCTLMYMANQWTKTFGTYRISEGVHPMIEIRLKNLGNCAEYRFDSNGNWDGKNNTKYFSEASVKYLVNNCLDLSKYAPEAHPDGGQIIRNGILRRECKIYGPEEWRSKLSEEDLQGARRKNISIYINNELVN